MRISDMSWQQVESYIERDDRVVIPLGSTEQHSHLSLSVDSILASKMAEDCAEPLGIPVYPVVHYGLAHNWSDYPGTVTLRIETYIALIRDLLDSVYRSGFRRVLIVNGHGGNSVASGMVNQWVMENPTCQVRWHDWWKAPKTWEQVQSIDPLASHASWMESFPWTRLANNSVPEEQKPMADMNKMKVLSPTGIRDYLGDGNMGGLYQRPDDDMQALWTVAVNETRELLVSGWR